MPDETADLQRSLDELLERSRRLRALTTAIELEIARVAREIAERGAGREEAPEAEQEKVTG